MDPTTQGALIAAGSGLLGTLLGTIGTYIITSKSNQVQQQIAASNLELQRGLAAQTSNAQRQAFLETMILKMNEFGIQYPTVEKDAYCESYPDCKGDANGKERYENYCAYVFNVLSAIYDYFNGDKEKIKSFVGVDELVRRHYRCWIADPDNLQHDDGFRHFIHGVMDDLRKTGKIK